MGMMDRLRSIIFPPLAPIYDPTLPFFTIGGHMYPLRLNQTLLGTSEGPPSDFSGLVDWAYHSNPVVYACEQARLQLFAEMKFKFRWFGSRNIFGGPELRLLERPWPNAVTADLLLRMLADADLAGDSFIVRTGSPSQLARLRPDWTSVITDADPWAAGSQIIGYAYQEGGPSKAKDPVFYDVSEVAHFTVSPDPLSPHRGMSWLTPVLREIAADMGMTEHKSNFLRNGATPNMIVTFDPAVSTESFNKTMDKLRARHRGVRTAYETIGFNGPTKVDVVGKDLQQLDFKLTQGAGETRIAAAAHVPPIIVGLSEGLEAATYSNYGQARRAFADGTMRPLWRNVCGSLATILNVPNGAELWYDDSEIAFLQEDLKDRADVLSAHMTAIGLAVDKGFTRNSAVAALTSGDLTQLVEDPNWVTVQVQPGNAVPQLPAQLPAPMPALTSGNGKTGGA